MSGNATDHGETEKAKGIGAVNKETRTGGKKLNAFSRF